MNKKSIFALMSAVVLMSSCKTTSTQSLDGEWNVFAPEGVNAKFEQNPFVGFDAQEGRIYGFAGCNRIMGTFSVKGKNSKIELGHMATTLMACPNMEQEQSILKALGDVERINATDADHLLLQNKNKETVLRLERRFRIVPLKEIAGEWRIVTVFGEKLPAMDEVPAVNFDIEAKRLSAYAGCNRLNAGFTAGEKNGLSVANVMSTRMACPDMTAEQTVSNALEQVKSYGVALDGNLLLFSAGGQQVMELMRNK